jgi:membrane protease YdiL (CAAX protease family)
VFSAEERAVPQILRCPMCGQCVTVPAAAFNPETPSSLWTVSRKYTWTRLDIAIGILFPILIIGLMDMVWFYGFHPTLLVGIFLRVINILCFTAIALWLYRKRIGVWPLQPISFKEFFRESLRAFCYLLIYFLGIYLLAALCYYYFGYTDNSNGMGRFDIFKSNTWFYIAALISAFTITPFCEELYFRGFLYNALKNRTHWIFAVIFQVLLFAFLHRYNWFGFLTIFWAGLLLTFLYERRKKLIAPILLHAQMNFLNVLAVLIFFMLNYHIPAKDWNEAKQNPAWLSDEPPAYVERQKTSEEQRYYAIHTWGSQGYRLWKREINTFHAFHVWFPEDQQACVNAKLSIAEIYTRYLKDYQRAVVAADDVIESDHGDRETKASAWLYKAYAYYYLGDYEKSLESVNIILNDYSDCGYEKDAAEYLIEQNNRALKVR